MNTTSKSQQSDVRTADAQGVAQLILKSHAQGRRRKAMTDDLVKRLRSNRPIPTLPHEAADRIEALTAENERLREALFESVALNENYYAVEEDDGYRFTEAPAVIAQARAALPETER